MANVDCGYCHQEVQPNDRYDIYLKSKGISIPAYLHNSCGVKIYNMKENEWHCHRLSNTYKKKQNNNMQLFN